MRYEIRKARAEPGAHVREIVEGEAVLATVYGATSVDVYSKALRVLRAFEAADRLKSILPAWEAVSRAMAAPDGSNEELRDAVAEFGDRIVSG